MRYAIERDEDGRWIISGYNDQGKVGVKIHCATTDDVMQTFLMLEGHTKHAEARTVDLLNPDTCKVA